MRGAFTGATESRQGLFGAADGGTVFLENLDHASKSIQATLLRTLKERSFYPVGSSAARRFDIRFVTAIRVVSGNLVGDISLDLLYRVRGIRILVPPLRERCEDIGAIAASILSKHSAALGLNLALAKDALAALRRYNFPGNISELESMLSQASVLTGGPLVHRKDIPIPKATRQRRAVRMTDEGTLRRELDAATRELEALRARAIAADPIWQGRHFTSEKDYCFVLMPFADLRNVQEVYRSHVKPAIERCGLRCERADDIYDISGVMQSVWEGINRARLILADLTERNANVFYELGIAHTLGKPVIMLTQHIEYIPFDLRHLRCIVYNYTPPGVAMLEKALEHTIRRALSLGESPRIAALQNTSGTDA